YINMVIDTAVIATLVPLIHFNLLPSFLLLTLTLVDKITTGIRGLWIHSLYAMLGAGTLATILLGVHWEPQTSMLVMLVCLPAMLLHSLSIGVASYQLTRKTMRQNRLLDELRRIDALTGLYGRGYWQEQAEAALQTHAATGAPACLLLLDIDHFKSVNDTYGHTVGDEVIRAMAQVVRANVRTTDCAGRYGGDEFAVILPGSLIRDAMTVAQRICTQTADIRLRQLPELRITSSIGVAQASLQYRDLRAWIDAADTALYVAKREGRNRVASGAVHLAEPSILGGVEGAGEGGAATATATPPTPATVTAA
ncbi:MAG: GGDEF domain-containing protein, partial [Burkholderiaceae bacterium]|nr:GGDEF domain-containing protein [Burkholderiaceae bacterium]